MFKKEKKEINNFNREMIYTHARTQNKFCSSVLSTDVYTIRNITKEDINIFNHITNNTYDKTYLTGPAFVESSQLRKKKLV